MYALNASTGAVLWKYATEGVVFSSPAVANGVVYVGSSDYSLYSFAVTGSSSPDKSNPPERPDPNLLRPDWTLQPSAPVTQIPNNLN